MNDNMENGRDEPADKPALACELDRMGTVFRNQGDLAKAMACFRKALDLWRELASGSPGRYTGKLYDSLLSLGYFRIIMGETEEGIAHWEEMLVVNRALADKGDLALPTLAYNLSMYGFMLERVRRVKESLAAHLEALNCYRRLAADDDSYVLGLAKCLNVVGSRYAELNRVDEGIRFVREAVARIDARPDMTGDENIASLCEFLFNLASLCRRTGGTEEADALCAEAVERARAAAATEPERLRTLLAKNLERLGEYRLRDGSAVSAVAALDALDEAAELYRRSEGGTGDDLRGLGVVLMYRGEALLRSERVGDAWNSFHQAASTYERLAAVDPYGCTGRYLTALCRLGYAAHRLGRREEVRALRGKALELETRFLDAYGLAFAPFVRDSFDSLE